jgi:hypothetical protein
LVEDAALLIQKTYRGWAGKQRHRRLFELHLQTYVDAPAALRLQVPSPAHTALQPPYRGTAQASCQGPPRLLF